MGQYRLLTERMFDEIGSLMKLMANDIANPDIWMLQYDEVLAELYAHMTEIVWEYEDVPWDELKKLVIKCLHRHKITLTRLCYETFRSLEVGKLTFDEDAMENIVVSFNDTFILFEFMDLLSDDARLLAQEVLHPSERTRWFIDLVVDRKITVTANGNGGWKLYITPLLMERALGWDKVRLSNAWDDISDTYSDYVHC